MSHIRRPGGSHMNGAHVAVSFPYSLKLAEGKGDAEGSIFSGTALSCLPYSPSVGLFQTHPHPLALAKCVKVGPSGFHAAKRQEGEHVLKLSLI